MIDSTILRTHQHAAGKKEPEARAIGRSRGGMSTKIHAVVDALGNPLRFILIAGLPADHVLAGKGYDSKALRETIVNQGAAPVIPPENHRHRCCDFILSCERSLVERFFPKIRHFRRTTTRYDQTPRAFIWTK